MASRRRKSAYSSYAPRRNVRQIGSRVFERRRRRYRRRGVEVARTAPAFWYDTEKRRFYSSPLFEESRRSKRLDVRRIMVGAPADFRVRKNGDVYFRGENIGWNVKRQPNPPTRLRTEVSDRLKNIPNVDEPGYTADELGNQYVQTIVVTNPDYEVASAAMNKHGELVAIFRNTRSGKAFSVNTDKPQRRMGLPRPR